MTIVVGLVAVVLLSGVLLYNFLVRRKNYLREAWSGIDVQLIKRSKVVPALINAVKAYTEQELNVLESVTRQRTTPTEKEVERESAGIIKISILAEDYPELKADDNFLKLQNDLKKIEEDLRFARKYYNGTVRRYNTAIETFPGNLMAGLTGMKEADYFNPKLSDESPNMKLISE